MSNQIVYGIGVVLSGKLLHYQYITTPSGLTDLVDKLRKVPTAAVDIEADSFHHYYPKVCLIQMSFDGDNFVIDPLAKLDMKPFFEVLGSKNLIFHDAGYDLRMLRLGFGFEPKGEIFDTMLAGKLLRLESLNLAGMLHHILEVTISKGSQKADWSKRPLPDHLLEYAAMDTHYLLELAARLEAMLQEQNRTGWHQQMCRRSVRAAVNHKPDIDPERDWRIKGSSLLNRRQLAFLKELWLWREKQAQKADLPPFRILHNERLVDLAIQADSHANPDFSILLGALKHCKGRRLDCLEQALQKAFAMESSEWPAKKTPTRQPKPDPDFLKRVDKIRDCCKAIAEQHHIALEILMPRHIIGMIAKSGPAYLSELLKEGIIVEWQLELLKEPLENCLRHSKSTSSTNTP